MTRTDAKMVAEELFRLFKKNALNGGGLISFERYIGTKEAAAMLGMSINTFYKKIREIPHIKKGKRHFFKESSLKSYIESNVG